MADVTVTPLTFDQVGAIIKTVGNPILLEETNRDRYALDVEVGLCYQCSC